MRITKVRKHQHKPLWFFLALSEEKNGFEKTVKKLFSVYSLLQHLLLATHFEQVAGEVDLV